MIASSLLGLGALIQIGVLVWAMTNRTRPLPASDEDFSKVEPGLPPFDPSAPSGPIKSAPPAIPFAQPGPQMASLPIMPPPRPVPVLEPKIGEISAPATRYQELVQQGKTLRERGDLGGAFTKFREAMTLEPANAQALAEIAVSYEKMGMAEKAAEHWRRILQMGEAAGSYYIAADARLKQSQALAMMAAQAQSAGQNPQNSQSAGQSGSAANPNATLSLDRILSQDLVDPNTSKKLMLSLPIRLRGQAKVNVRDVKLYVLFYDILNARTVVETSANVLSRWASGPPDWTDSDSEVLEVEYSQPRADPRDLNREDRKYFGYIVRLYYKGELQDSRAEPQRLAAQFPAPQTFEKDPP